MSPKCRDVVSSPFPNHRLRSILGRWFWIMSLVLSSVMADVASFAQDRIDPRGIPGVLFVTANDKTHREVWPHFVKLAMERRPSPAAGKDEADKNKDAANNENEKAASPLRINFIVVRDAQLDAQKLLSYDRDFKIVSDLKSLTVIAFNPEEQSQTQRILQLLKFRRPADAVWIQVDRDLENVEEGWRQNHRNLIAGLIQSGFLVGGTLESLALDSTPPPADSPPDQLSQVLPGTIVRVSEDSSLDPAELSTHSGFLTIDLAPSSTLLLKGRRLSLIGNSPVRLSLNPTATLPVRTGLLSEDNADWIAWRRAAHDRSEPPFPPARLAVPKLSNGSLVIVGGGELDDAIVKEFVRRAGGESARIVCIPTAGDPPVISSSEEPARFIAAGAGHAEILHAATPEESRTQRFRDALSRATGVWWGGGRQWRYVDVYEQPETQALFHQVLERGGVIGGTSAGATIQGEYLVRGSPLGNEEMMAEGYERGFAFLKGTAIDQHFTQRKREPDLRAVIERHPQLLGIGVDESTALIVDGQIAQVMGQHSVTFIFVSASGQVPQALVVKSGESFDLVKRVAVTPKDPRN